MKKRECSYCGNMVEDTDYSDKPELHKKNCPVREIMEFRIADDKEEDDKLACKGIFTLPKGIIIRVGGFPYKLVEDTKVHLRE